MPTPSTQQSQMTVHKGRSAGIDSNGQIDNIAFKMNTVSKTSAYTCLPSESGTVYDTVGATAAVTFTLPAVATTGWVGYFVSGADVNMAIASAEGDNIVAINDASADSITFQTTAELIGASVMVVSNGTKWLVFYGADEAQTATIAS